MLGERVLGPVHTREPVPNDRAAGYPGRGVVGVARRVECRAGHACQVHLWGMFTVSQIEEFFGLG